MDPVAKRFTARTTRASGDAATKRAQAKERPEVAHSEKWVLLDVVDVFDALGFLLFFGFVSSVYLGALDAGDDDHGADSASRSSW